MSLVEELRQEASSEHVAYTEFILKYDGTHNYFFCFFEGKDDIKYYGVRIDSIVQRKYHSISCGGKGGVIEVRRLLNQRPEYNEVKTYFFLDSDYSEPLSIDGVYCLPCYSIENKYANKETLIKILNTEFQIKSTDADFGLIISKFDTLMEEFLKEITYINSWLACQSDKREQLGITTYLRIDSAIGSYFSVVVKHRLNGINDFSDLKDLNKIETLFPSAPKITENELKTKLEYFNGKSLVNRFRGKFQMKFFISFLTRLQSEIGQKQSSIFNKKYKCSLRFEFATALTNLSIYAETPICLYEYLNKIKENITQQSQQHRPALA